MRYQNNTYKLLILLFLFIGCQQETNGSTPFSAPTNSQLEDNTGDETSSTMVDNPLSIEVHQEFLSITKANQEGHGVLTIKRNFISLSANHPLEKVILKVFQNGTIIYKNAQLENQNILAIISFEIIEGQTLKIQAESMITQEKPSISIDYNTFLEWIDDFNKGPCDTTLDCNEGYVCGQDGYCEINPDNIDTMKKFKIDTIKEINLDTVDENIE